MATLLEALDPAQVAVQRPIWELHKKGEIMPSRTWDGKYGHFSMEHLKHSYQVALTGRIKYFHKMANLRGQEPPLGKQGKKPFVPSFNPVVQPLADDGQWSDTSSQQSMFKPSTFRHTRQLQKSESTPSIAPKEAPEVTALCEKIGRLIEEPMVQTACTHKPMKGTKYLFFGGGATYSDQFRHHSKQDPWEFP